MSVELYGCIPSEGEYEVMQWKKVLRCFVCSAYKFERYIARNTK